MLWNVTLPVLFFLISCSDCGKASAKRGSRQDSSKLVATLCHYYSDGAMGCKECFEVARSHRSNHNSTLLPPCKSVQGIKRRNWTLDDGIITNIVIDTNATKRLTIASCAFYANKTFTCVATRPQCENLTQIECANSTSWSSHFEGSVTEGFRCIVPHEPKSSTTITTRPTPTKSSTIPTVTFTTKNATKGNRSSATSTVAGSTTVSSFSTSRHSTMATMMFGQVSDSANEIHKIPILEMTTLATTRESKPPLTLDFGGPTAATPNKPFTLTSRVTTQVQTDGYTENCTETSCTIFAETSQPNTTDWSAGDNQTSNNQSLSRSMETNVTTTETPNSETLITLSPLTTASQVNRTSQIQQEELVTLSPSHLYETSSSTSSTTTTTPTPTPTTTKANTSALMHTLDLNRTLATVKPEPRKRHPVRRMY